MDNAAQHLHNAFDSDDEDEDYQPKQKSVFGYQGMDYRYGGYGSHNRPSYREQQMQNPFVDVHKKPKNPFAQSHQPQPQHFDDDA